MEEIVQFECRLLREKLQPVILEKVQARLASSETSRDTLVDMVWKVEEIFGVKTAQEGYLSSYMLDLQVGHKRLGISDFSRHHPRTYKSFDHMAACSRSFEVELILTLFYQPVHDLQQLAVLLQIWIEVIEV